MLGHSAGRRQTVRWIFQFALLGAAVGSLPGMMPVSRWQSILLAALLGALAGVVFALGIMPWLQRRSLRKTPGLVGSFVAELDTTGVTLQSQDGRETTRRWTDLTRLSPDRDHLFLYWKDGQVTPLPRRAFTAEAGEAEIRALMQGKGGSPRAARKSGADRGKDSGIELRVERTSEDLAYFAWHQNLHDPALRLRTWLAYAVVTGLAIYLLAAVLPGWGAALAGLAISALLPRVYFGLLKYQGAAMLRQAGAREVRVRFEASGVTESCGGSAAKIRWDDVSRIEETPSLLLIYVNRLQAVVVPRRCLGAAGEAEAHLDQIQSWYAAVQGRRSGAKAKR